MVDKDGARVGLHDEMENPRVAMGVGKGGPDVVLVDEKGNPLVALGVTNDGPRVALQDEKRNSRAVLGSIPLEAARTGDTEVTAPSSLTLFDKAGKLIWRAP